MSSPKKRSRLSPSPTHDTNWFWGVVGAAVVLYVAALVPGIGMSAATVFLALSFFSSVTALRGLASSRMGTIGAGVNLAITLVTLLVFLATWRWLVPRERAHVVMSAVSVRSFAPDNKYVLSVSLNNRGSLDANVQGYYWEEIRRLPDSEAAEISLEDGLYAYLKESKGMRKAAVLTLAAHSSGNTDLPGHYLDRGTWERITPAGKYAIYTIVALPYTDSLGSHETMLCFKFRGDPTRVVLCSKYNTAP